MSYRERPALHRSVTRSISPDSRDHHHHRHRHHHTDSAERSRSRSPERSRHHYSHHRHKHDRHTEETRRTAAPIELPFGARQLSKRDLPVFEPMFAMYLDIQKGLLMEDLNEEEVKGRWKSFVGKWNRGELAEGWYDPATFERARRSAAEEPLPSRDNTGRRRPSPVYDGRRREEGPQRTEDKGEEENIQGEEEDDDEDYGPKLPHPDMSAISAERKTGARSGPMIPNTQDLEIRRETAIADAIAAREDRQMQYRAEIRSHKAEMRHIEDEIAPRAEPGTHERRMEKRQEAAAANREFARAARGGSPVEAAPEAELMGGENDLETLKKEREREQRKKNERELRREEMLRARAAEREERLQRYRQKEEETMGWLKALAKQRFG